MLAGAVPRATQQAGRAQQPGPMTAYYRSLLMQPVQIAQRNPAGESGWGGGFESTVNFFTNFLQGIAEGRRQRIAEIEADRENKMNLLQQRLLQVEQSDLVPEAKREIRDEILSRMQKIALGEDEERGKARQKKSFPMDFLSLMADFIGPKIRPQAPPLEDFTAGLEQRMKQAPTVQQLILEAQSDFAKAVEESTLKDDSGVVYGVSRSRLAAHPAFQAASRKLAQAGVYEVPKSWEEQIGAFISPDDEIKIQRRISADRFERNAMEALRAWEQQRVSGQMQAPASGQDAGSTPSSEDILGPVVQVPADVFIERKPTKIFLDHPYRQTPPLAVWDFGNGIRVEIGTGRLVSPNAEQMGWVNRGASAPKPMEMDSPEVIQASLEHVRQYGQSAKAPNDILDRAEKSFQAAVKATGKASDGVNAYRSVIDAWERREDRALQQQRMQSDREAARQIRKDEISARLEQQIRDDLSKVYDQKQAVDKIVKMMERYRSGRWNGGVDDGTLVFLFNKVLDPTSVVRDSEYERVRGFASAIASLRAAVAKFNKGDQLADETRKAIFDTISSLGSVYDDIYETYAAQAMAQIESNRKRGFEVDPDAAIPAFSRYRDRIERKLQEMRGEGAGEGQVAPQQPVPPSPFRNRGRSGASGPGNAAAPAGAALRPIIGRGARAVPGLVMI